MREVTELIFEARRVHSTESVGELTLGEVFGAIVALECARASQSSRPASLEFKPALEAEIRAFVDQFPDLSASASDIYRGAYGREPSAAEARSAAVLLRRMGMASGRSNGRTIWRHL